MSRRPPLTRRPTRTIPAVIAAIAVAALGATAVWAAGVRLVRGRFPTQLDAAAEQVGSRAWSDPVIVTIAAALVVLGLVALVCAAKPGAPSSLPVNVPGVPHDPASAATVIGRRSVARLAAGLADLVDGVDQVTAVVGRRTVRVRVRGPVHDQPEAADEIRTAVSAQVTAGLASTGLDPAPAVVVTVRPS